jgi:hypothetical protein
MRPMLRSLAVFASIAAAGCSILLNPAAAKQCDVDSDCEGEPALRGMICRGGICARPAGPGLPVAADGGPACVDSATCTKANTGKASVCKVAGGPCTQWQTAQCATIAGKWDDPNVIMIGAILPLTFKQKSGELIEVKLSKRQEYALKIALTDLTDKNPWFIVQGNVKRPLGLLVCDSFGDPALAGAAFDHLTQAVGAQAMFVSYDNDLEAIAQKATEKQIAIACTDCQAPLPSGPLVWSMFPQIAHEAVLVASRVKELEQTLPKPIKVTLLKEFGLAQNAFAARLLTELTMNNAPAKDQIATEQNPERPFQVIDLPDGRDSSYLPQAIAEKIRDHGPHIVIAAMGPDFPTKYLSTLESASVKPHYVLTSLSRDSALEYSSHLITSTTGLRERISGTRPYQTDAIKRNMEAFSTHFFNNANFQPPNGAEASYDAFFSLFYALASAATQPIIDGPHISAGFESLIGGPPPTINVGTADIHNALFRLAQKQSIDLEGSFSSLDWDKKTHELPADIGMWCFKDPSTINDNAGPRYKPSDPSAVGQPYKCE